MTIPESEAAGEETLVGVRALRPPRSEPVTAPRRDRARLATGSRRLSRIWTLAGLVLILLAFLVPRLHELDRVVTPDEPIWLARSANFYEALSSGNWDATYQYAHPGVPVMWLGAAGYFFAAPDYPDQEGGQISQRQDLVSGVLRSHGYEPLDVLVSSRQSLIVGMAVVFAVAYLYAVGLLGHGVATFGFLLIALEPFSIGLTKLLHVDGMASLLMLLSVVASLSYLGRGRRHRDLLVAGVAAGLTVLTRIQAGILAPYFVAMLLIDTAHWHLNWPGRDAVVHMVVRPALVWGITALGTCLVFWPALWSDPLGVARGIFDFAETAALEGHERVVFFVGFVYEGDPGWRFYPATFFWRASPVVVIGVMLGILSLVLYRRLGVSRADWRTITGILIAVSGYGFMMTVAAKKFDRYLLPVYPLLAIVAAWGIFTVVRRVSARLPGPERILVGGIILAATLLHGSGSIATAPYYLSYYSPMLGGAEEAQTSMMVGWGEGLDQVASYLNEQPDAEQIVVATESWRTPLRYFLDGQATFASFVDDPPGIYRWANSDYYVLYITPLSRNGIWPDVLKEFESRTPVLTVNLEGVDYARLYDIRDDPVPLYMETGNAGMVNWTGLGRMVATGIRSDRGSATGDTINAVLYFDGVDEDSDDGITAHLRLVAPDGEIVATSEAPLDFSPPVRHDLWPAEVPITIPIDAASATHRLEISFVDEETGKVIVPFSHRLGERLGETALVRTTYVYQSGTELDDPEILEE